MSAARKTNLSLAVVVVIIAGAISAAAVFGDRTSEVVPNVVTTSTSTTNPVGDSDSEEAPITADASGARPANLDGSWFSGQLKGDADFAMEKLRCSELRPYLTLDLCAVASTSHGSFMLTASEGYWDPAEPDKAGVVEIPLYFNTYTFSAIGGPPRAVKDLEGVTTRDYESSFGARTIQLFRGKLGRDEILALVSSGDADSASYQVVHIIAMSPTGAPVVVATYSGTDLRLAIDRASVVISFSRYGPPTGEECCPDYATIMRLTPGPNGWTETFTSTEQTEVLLDGMTPLSLIDKYVFPFKSSGSGSN